MRHVLVLGLLAAGCSSGDRSEGSRPELRPDPVEKAAVSPPEPSPPPPAPILGSEGIVAVVPPEARRLNQRGLSALRKGNATQARDLFRDALRIATWDGARYNLVCALSVAGDAPAAARELEPLLWRDPGRTLAGWAADPDLAALRSSAAGAGIRVTVNRIAASLRTAISEGIPAVLWDQGPWDRVSELPHEQTLRAGVWVQRTRRFVTLAPQVPKTVGAVVDLRHQRLVLVTGARNETDGNTIVDPAMVVRSLDPTSRPLVEASVGDSSADDCLGIENLEVGVTDRGVRVRFEDCYPVRRSGSNKWRLFPDWRTVAPDQSETADPVTSILNAGSMLRPPPPAGLSVRGKTLTTPSGPIQLGPGYAPSSHSVVLSPDGRTAIVWAVLHGPGCDEAAPSTQHVVDRVDLVGRGVERLSRGEGGAAALFGPDGSLYLQVDRALRRYENARARTFETIPGGVLLTSPLFPEPCPV